MLVRGESGAGKGTGKRISGLERRSQSSHRHTQLLLTEEQREQAEKRQSLQQRALGNWTSTSRTSPDTEHGLRDAERSDTHAPVRCYRLGVPRTQAGGSQRTAGLAVTLQTLSHRPHAGRGADELDFVRTKNVCSEEDTVRG